MNGTWLKEAKELKRQRVAVEKEVISVLHALQKENPTAVSELEVISRSYDADRLREREALIAQCERLKGMRLQLGMVARSEPEPGQLKKLRLLVTSLETALCAFRDGQRRTYDVLRKEELQLTEEIAAVEAASSEWAKEVPFDLDPSPAPPPPAPRRTRSASVGTVSRLTKGAPSSAAAPLQEPAADADANGPSRAALERERLERERKRAALEVYRLQKQAEKLREEQEEQERKLAEAVTRAREAEAAAVRRAAVLRYKQERALLEERAARARAHTPAGLSEVESFAAAVRVEAAIASAAEKAEALARSREASHRSEMALLLAAQEQKRRAAAALAKPQARAAGERLFSTPTAAVQARQAEEEEARRAMATARVSAHDSIVPSSAGVDRSKGMSYTFGTGSARAVPAWRSQSGK